MPPRTSSIETKGKLLDVTRPPLGERQRREILAEIVAGGDTAEKHYLEVKSDLDFSSREETSKIVKFILGAGNRLPDLAAGAFGGYALMVIGAKKGALPGVPAGIEILQIEHQIGKYLPDDGPRWDLEREPADTPEREVLFILVDPPHDGDPIQLCRGNFQGAKANLADGDIYVRAQGETRKAKASEIDALMVRAKKSASANPELTVELTGKAHYVDTSPEAMDAFVSKRIGPIRQKYANKRTQNTPLNPLSMDDTALRALGMGPVASTPAAVEGEIKEWVEKIRSSWQKNLEEMAGALVPGLFVKLDNLEPAFLEAVRLDLTLERAFGVRTSHPEDVDPEKLFPPVLKQRNPLGYFGITSPLLPYDFGQIRPAVNTYPLTWSNTEDNLTISIELPHLRPGTPWISDGDDFVVLARDKESTSISGFWQATARGHNTTFKGTVTLPMGSPLDIQSLLQRHAAHQDGDSTYTPPEQK